MSQEVPAGSAVVTPNEMLAEIRGAREEGRQTQHDVRELKAIIDPAITELRNDIVEEKQRRHEKDEALEKAVRNLQENVWSSAWVKTLMVGALVAGAGGLIVSIVGTTIGAE